ncbi:hypothetical protein ACN38_g5521 [Penicillium nordicum]|uniref:Uncharacterized protein n=1 Tax=Penicillium nordicum TaxID=229535 RepID=A0A0M9WG54_9EURO|nr:hypothetical protein ACN38_g5521 [Penicillium nordicum]
MANFIMPRTTCHEPDTLSSDELTNTPRKPFTGAIHLNTLWCLPCFRDAVREWMGDEDGPLQIDCYIMDAPSKACGPCKAFDQKCDLIPQGIRGHVFELMALITFVEKYWTDCSELWQGDDNPEAEWPGDFMKQLSAAVKCLCAAFDDLVETHRKAHLLIGNVSDEAKAGYSAWCNARERTICPNTHRSDKLHLQYAFRATEYLRLRRGEEGSVHWAMSI